MGTAWLTIPLEDYEGHMRAASVQQISVLSEIFQDALRRMSPASVAVVGVAGGNGLEHIDPEVTRRVVGVDINPRHLEEVRRRFETLAGLELYCCDLNRGALEAAPVDMVHAAMIFEHAGVGRALDNTLALVAPGGCLCVVLQLPSETQQEVAPTGYESIQRVKQDFALIEPEEFERMLGVRGFRLIEKDRRPLPGGKAFWVGFFASAQG